MPEPTQPACCCVPHPGHQAPAQSAHQLGAIDQARNAGVAIHAIEQARIPAHVFMMGDSLGDGYPGDGEHPVHAVELSSFTMDVTSVTNADFERFIEATGYQTDAERFGYSAVFHLALTGADSDVLGRPAHMPWWLVVRDASWRQPGGRGSSIEGIRDHPVTHVSFNDAHAYCQWAGRDLPSEAQWEAASRGGLEGLRYPWGDRPCDANGEWRLNIWQGEFPISHSGKNGCVTTAPVRQFRPNAYGLWQTVGNVWEWCRDAWSPRTYQLHAAQGVVKDPEVLATVDDADALRVMRGGSYLCHDSYCNRYRNAARTANSADASMGNAGFRTVSRHAQ